MIDFKSKPNDFSKEFTEEERVKISEAVNLITDVADEMVIVIGKRYVNENGEAKSKTTAAIYATPKYKLSVAEKLREEGQK